VRCMYTTSGRSSTCGKRQSPRVYDFGPDGTAIPQATMPLRDARTQDEAIPLVVRVAMRPLCPPVLVETRREPETGPHVVLAGSGG